MDYIVCFLKERCLIGLQDDKDGPRLADDDNFIDDIGVDPADRYASDQGGYSPSRAPQV